MAPRRRTPRLRRRRDAKKIAAIHNTAHRRPENSPTDPAQSARSPTLVSHTQPLCVEPRPISVQLDP
jgi:hypothetical protein